MHKYELVNHTADVKIKLTASCFKELFQAGLEAMAFLISKKAKKNEIYEEMVLESYDRTSLLVDFLGEVLVKTHLRKVVFTKISFNLLSETKLEATIFGQLVDHFERDVKAVTYHEAFVEKNPQNEWISFLIFDI